MPTTLVTNKGLGHYDARLKRFISDTYERKGEGGSPVEASISQIGSIRLKELVDMVKKD